MVNIHRLIEKCYRPPNQTVNQLIIAVWGIDNSINASTILRHRYRIIENNKIQVPQEISQEKQLILKDMVIQQRKLSFAYLRRYGFSVSDIRQIDSVNGTNFSARG